MSICGPPDFSYGRTVIEHARARALALLLLVCLGASIPTYAPAACKSPLPIESLRDLDQRVDADPAGISEEVRRQLGVADTADALRMAALYAVSADAYNLLDDDDHARLAVADGRERLLQIHDGDAKRAIEFRFDLLEADSPRNKNDMAASVDRLIKLEQALPVASLERVCLLIVRSRLSTQLLRDDEATTDGNEAYRMATTLHLPAARAEASYQLAVTYLRVGLLDDAVQFVDQAANYERATKMYARLSNALYVKADVLEQMRNYDAALAVISEARAINVSFHQTIDVAFDDQKKCQILLDSSQFDIAEQTCLGAQAVLASAGRADLVAVIHGSLARIDLLRGRPVDALARLDDVLRSGVDRIPAKTLPKLYRYRSEALDRLGRSKAALRDMREAARLTEAAELERRSLAAARIKERFTTESLIAERNAIETQMQRERQEAEAQQRQARLVLTLSIALGLLLVSIVALMWNRARRERALRRAAETLEAQAHVISTVQEGVLFIDDTDAIVYANESASRLLGRARDALVGLTVGAVGLSPETLRSAGELQLSDATGRNRTVQLTTSTVSIQDRPLRLGVLRDVTEFRRLEREVLALAGRERTLQSAEVHEGIAQDLAGISLLLRGLHGAAPADEAALESVIEHVLEVIARSRALAQSLTPVQMAGGSLATALERLAAEFNDGQGPNVIFLRNGDEPTLGTASAEQLYRIARECLCVVAQQTGCHEITMKLGSSREVLMLAISGDGETPESARNENGLAWATIAHLARLIDGTASTEFLTGHGARTTITVPLQAA